jgi:hypothetical protein
VGALLYLLSAASTLVLVRRFTALSRWAAAVLILLPLCLTGRALVTGRGYAPIDVAYHFDPLASMATRVGIDRIANPLPSDVVVQFLPWNAALRWSIAHHRWPLWNPFELSGNVLAAAAQSAPFHPITLLGLLIPAPDALGFMAAMTYFLAALGMFLLLRKLELRQLPSLFGAAGWSLSTNAANGAGSMRVGADGSRLLLHASMQSAGWIVVSEAAWHGWRATSGRDPIKLHFADHAFLGMYVPAGVHDVVMSYRPKVATTGAITSLAAAKLLMIGVIARRRF